MFKTNDINTAISYAKQKVVKAADYKLQSHKRIFAFTPEQQLCCNPGMSFNPVASEQAAKIFKIPPAWIKVKQAFEDLSHLEESFNRHVQMMGNRGLIFRCLKPDNPQDPKEVYALWSAKTVNIDILPMLRLVKDTIGSEARRYSIQITGHVLRLICELKYPREPKSTIPGIYVTTSDDGSFGLKCGLCMIQENTSMWFTSELPQLEGYSFKRKEAKEGQLVERFTSALSHLLKKKKPLCEQMDKLHTQMLSMGVNTDQGLSGLLEMGRKILTYSGKVDNILVGHWVSELPVPLAYLVALTKTARDVAFEGDPVVAHSLNRAAGILISLSGTSTLDSLVGLTKIKS